MAKKILLADDSVTIQKVVSITLAHEDFDLTIVDNGSKAVTKAKEIKPDVILLDVVMPDKDGYQVCQEIKRNAELSNIPIILLTGTFEPFDADRAAEVGADDFIKKPFKSHTLINKVKEMAAKSGRPREKPVDISEVDIGFETPVEAQYGEETAQKRSRTAGAPPGAELESNWEEEGGVAGPSGKEQEGEDIWSVEEFEDISGAKREGKTPKTGPAPSIDRKGASPGEQAPVREASRQAPPLGQAASDDFFVRDEKLRDVEVEDFELGEEISEDELEKFLEEETDGEIAIEEAPPTDVIGASDTYEEVLLSDEGGPSPRREQRPAGRAEEELLVEDFGESPAGDSQDARKQAEDFFVVESAREEPVELEWEDEPLAEKGRAPAVEKTVGEFETLIRRTAEEELAEYTRKPAGTSDEGRRPASREFEVDLNPFEEATVDKEVADDRPEPATFDFGELSEEAPAKGITAGAFGAAESLDQKDVSKVVDKIVREVVEKVVWEVVPELAEELIKQEIKRLKGEKA